MSAKDHLLELIERVSETHGLTLLGCMVLYMGDKRYQVKALRQGHTEDEFMQFVEVLDTLPGHGLEWYVFFSGDFLYTKDYWNGPWVLSTYEGLPELIKR